MERNIKSPCDLIELSDLFRRAVSFTEAESAKRLVSLTRDFGAALTNLERPYSMDKRINRDVIQFISDVISEMNDIASRIGVSKIVFPLHEDHFYSDIIRKYVLDQAKLETTFAFRDSEYDKDLDDAGIIKPEISTFLDEWICGLGAIRSELKYKWRADIRKGGQMNLDFG